MANETTFPADVSPTPGRAGGVRLPDELIGKDAPVASQTPPAAAGEVPVDIPSAAAVANGLLDTVKTKPWQTAGVAIGIGSAAVAAALLYTNRSKKD